MKNMCKPLNEIEGLSAEDILKKFEQYDNIPVDIKYILDSIGATLIEDDLEEFIKEKYIQKKIQQYGELCGIVLATKEVLAIIYKKYSKDLIDQKNNKSIRNRTRFTLAHELAHCALHATTLEDVYLDFRCANTNISNKTKERDNYEQMEYEANVFAGQLLIPEHSLKIVLSKLLEPSLKYLSDLFEVSSNVMRERLKYLSSEYIDDV